MKIFILGSHKTGITSISKLFELLGYKSFQIFISENISYNYHDLYDNIDLFLKKSNYFIENNNINFFHDSPFNHFDYYKTIYKYYPDAKYILLVRDCEKWYNSVCRWVNKYHLHGMYHNLYKYDITDKKNIIKYYNERNKKICSFFKQNKNFLMIDIDESDKLYKICHFLNIKKPEINYFPHENKNI